MDLELSVQETLERAATEAQLNDIKALLGRMMFTGKSVHKKVTSPLHMLCKVEQQLRFACRLVYSCFKVLAKLSHNCSEVSKLGRMCPEYCLDSGDKRAYFQFCSLRKISGTYHVYCAVGARAEWGREGTPGTGEVHAHAWDTAGAGRAHQPPGHPLQGDARRGAGVFPRSSHLGVPRSLLPTEDRHAHYCGGCFCPCWDVVLPAGTLLMLQALRLYLGSEQAGNVLSTSVLRHASGAFEHSYDAVQASCRCTARPDKWSLCQCRTVLLNLSCPF